MKDYKLDKALYGGVNEMKRMIAALGIFILVLAVTPVYAQSTLPLQEKCAEGAKRLMEDDKISPYT
jgi:hypothetical protein